MSWLVVQDDQNEVIDIEKHRNALQNQDWLYRFADYCLHKHYSLFLPCVAHQVIIISTAGQLQKNPFLSHICWL